MDRDEFASWGEDLTARLPQTGAWVRALPRETRDVWFTDVFASFTLGECLAVNLLLMRGGGDLEAWQRERLPFANNKILKSIVMFIQIYMMHNFTFPKWPSGRLSCDKNMLRNVPSLVRVWVARHQDVEISITKARSLSSLPLRLGNQYATAFPVVIIFGFLISFCGFASFHIHLTHRIPDNLLRCVVFNGNFRLRHQQNVVIVLQFLLGKWNAVSVLIAHAGIVSDASRKEVISC